MINKMTTLESRTPIHKKKKGDSMNRAKRQGMEWEKISDTYMMPKGLY